MFHSKSHGFIESILQHCFHSFTTTSLHSVWITLFLHTWMNQLLLFRTRIQIYIHMNLHENTLLLYKLFLNIHTQTHTAISYSCFVELMISSLGLLWFLYICLRMWAFIFLYLSPQVYHTMPCHTILLFGSLSLAHYLNSSFSRVQAYIVYLAG